MRENILCKGSSFPMFAMGLGYFMGIAWFEIRVKKDKKKPNHQNTLSK